MVGNIKHYNGRAIREQTIVNSLFCMCYWEEYTLLFTHRSSLFNAWIRGKSLSRYSHKHRKKLNGISFL